MHSQSSRERPPTGRDGSFAPGWCVGEGARFLRRFKKYIIKNKNKGKHVKHKTVKKEKKRIFKFKIQ
jgi:hypothetical protein